MNKKLITVGIFFIGLTLISIFFISRDSVRVVEKEKQVHEEGLISDEKTSMSSGIILFYGIGCPHCAVVEKFIDNNNIKNSILFEEKEVYYNKINSSQLAEKAKECGILGNNFGVPFLWTGDTCLMGDRDIIEFFKSKLNP